MSIDKSNDLAKSTDRFLNRELSSLKFNQRVLEEAQNTKHPLFERVRFVSIAASNLEEFFMVRVAGLKAQVKAGVTSRSSDGLSPQQQLDEVKIHSAELIRDMQSVWHDLREELVQNDIKIIDPKKLGKHDQEWLEEYFMNEVFPLLSPIAVDTAHPFPFIPNKEQALVMHVKDTSSKHDIYVLIRLPESLPRFIKINNEPNRFILIEQLITFFAAKLLPPPLKIKNHAVFRLIRDSEIDIDDEAEDLVLTFESALKQRRRGNVIQLIINNNVGDTITNFLVKHLNIEDHQVRAVKGLVGLADIAELISDYSPDFLFEPFDARFPERIRDFNGDCFAAIRHKDIVVHHPFESFDVVVQFLKQAANDPNVVAIKQTFYRTSDDSPIVKALIEAAENGKTVTAMVELKARFDEEANIRWARDMERAGIQVVYGFMDLKTHAKMSLILRREGNRLRPYAHFGTGNYHPINAKVYTDLSYFTCKKSLCHDAALIFNFMTGYAKPEKTKALSAAPLNLRQSLVRLIRAETRHAKAGRPANIVIKCNALLDAQIIDRLYEASNAGVKIELIVRGICTLRPGIEGLSENIHVKSVVGRFLEHSRIYCFGNGHPIPSEKTKVYISSADIMERNLDRRIEAFIPIKNKTVHKQILNQIIIAYLKDTQQSWTMNSDGSYTRDTTGKSGFSAHEYFMHNPSLSGRGTSLHKAPMPPNLLALIETRQTLIN